MDPQQFRLYFGSLEKACCGPKGTADEGVTTQCNSARAGAGPFDEDSVLEYLEMASIASAPGDYPSFGIERLGRTHQ